MQSARSLLLPSGRFAQFEQQPVCPQFHKTLPSGYGASLCAGVLSRAFREHAAGRSDDRPRHIAGTAPPSTFHLP
jgi:hypothetical protein